MATSAQAITGRPDEIALDAAQQLTFANRILARQGVVDTFGHVSLRSPLRPDRFLIARSLAPERVVPADIVELDLDGEATAAGAPPSYIERFIHAEIYRARADVQSVIHSHSPSVLPFSVVESVPMRCVCHTAGFVGSAVPVFEIRDEAGENSDLLIRTARLGKALAACLGNQAVVLMRGHGSTTVGASLPQAVFRAIYAELNARIQFQSIQLGPVRYLTSAEAELATSTNAAVARAWDLWTHQVRANLGVGTSG